MHHPPIFPTLTSLTDAPGAEGLVLRAAESGIAVVAAHTNADSAEGGLNDLLAARLGIGKSRPLVSDPSACVGPGRIGAVAEMSVAELVERVRGIGRGVSVQWTGDPDRRADIVACCTGSGASLIELARDVGADAYVTSDLKYHDHDRAPELALIEVPHAAVEAPLFREWTVDRLRVPGLTLVSSAADTNPWRW